MTTVGARTRPGLRRTGREPLRRILLAGLTNNGGSRDRPLPSTATSALAILKGRYGFQMRGIHTATMHAGIPPNAREIVRMARVVDLLADLDGTLDRCEGKTVSHVKPTLAGESAVTMPIHESHPGPTIIRTATIDTHPECDDGISWKFRLSPEESFGSKAIRCAVMCPAAVVHRTPAAGARWLLAAVYGALTARRERIVHWRGV